MLRILFLSIVPSPYQRDLFAQLDDLEDMEISVCYAQAARKDSPWPKADLAPYERVYRSWSLSIGSKEFIFAAGLPSAKGYDAVILNGYVTIPAQWLLRTVSKDIPLLFWAEKMQPEPSGLFAVAQRLLTRPLSRLAAIVAIGKKAKRDYEQRFQGIPVYEIPYLCSIDGFRSSSQERHPEHPKILFCGQMIPRKGVDLLIAAFRRLLRDGYQAELVLVGRQADLQAMLQGVSDEVMSRIHYLGFKAPEDLPEVFADADVFVLPSRYDGWGVVVNQAIGAGLPVICSDAVGAAEDLVIHGENGYVVPAEDAEALYAALQALLEDPRRRHCFGAASLRMSEKLNPAFGAREFRRIVGEVVAHKRPSGGLPKVKEH